LLISTFMVMENRVRGIKEFDVSAKEASKAAISFLEKRKGASMKFTIRTAVQIFFFLLIGVVAVTSATSLHALCPFGGVVTLYHLLSFGTLVQKIHMSSVVLMVLVLILTILFGPVFCGWVCPLGSIQEWIGRLGKRLFRHRYNHFMPEKADRILGLFRYVVLIGVVYMTAATGYLLFANIDPYNALFKFWSEEVALPALIILAITLLAALFMQRPWCRYTCPYGALLGLFNKFRIFKIRRNPDTCIQCGNCDSTCPMGIKVSEQEKITDTRCVSCFECSSERHCPKAETVVMGKIPQRSSNDHGWIARKINIKMSAMAIIVLFVIFGGIGASMAMDIWSTQHDRNQRGVQTVQSEESIRGSTTFGDVLAMGITQEDIEAVIGGEMPSSNLRVKDYCDAAGLSFTVIKEQLLLYLD